MYTNCIVIKCPLTGGHRHTKICGRFSDGRTHWTLYILC